MIDSPFVWTDDYLDLLAGILRVDLTSPGRIRDTAAHVRVLTQNFVQCDAATVPEKGVYGDRDGSRTGYTLYYLLKNVPRLVHIFERVPGTLRGVSRALDLGTGPGTALLAWLIARQRRGLPPPGEIAGVDASRGFTDLARRIVSGFARELNQGSPSTWHTVDLTVRHRTFTDTFPLVIAANVLGEIPASMVEAVRDTIGACVEPGGILVLMAPALRWSARRLLTIRNNLCEAGWWVEAPCPGQFPCPALRKARDWCHHRLSWDPPAFIREVERRAGYRKRLLNFTWVVMRKPGRSVRMPEADFGEYIVVSDLFKRKGKYEIHVCGHDPRDPAVTGIFTVVLEKKRMTPQHRAFLTVKRHDRIHFENIGFKNALLLINKETGVRINH